MYVLSYFQHLFCVTKNGTIVNNKFFSEDLSGYFIVTVKVADSGGNDTADITVSITTHYYVVLNIPFLCY